MSTAPRSRVVRRLLALPLLAGLALSWTLEWPAALCTSTTASAGEVMAMPMAATDMAPGDRHAHGAEGGEHTGCPPATDGEGPPPCPFAVGGTGPCGTTAPAPTTTVSSTRAAVERFVRAGEDAPAPPEHAISIPHPPPRSTA